MAHAPDEGANRDDGGNDAMVTRSSAVRGGPVPGVIKRNTFLLAATQAFVGMGTQMIPALGPIIVMQSGHGDAGGAVHQHDRA